MFALLRPPTAVRGLWVAGLVFVLVLAASVGHAVTLANAPGDGQVSVSLDAYGSFGYQTDGIGTDDAEYDPLGPVGPSTTTWESAVYFRKAGTSKFLTTGLVGTTGQSGGLPNPGFTATTPTTATSAFTYAGLSFELAQRLDDVMSGSVRIGSVLVQTYTITNPGSGPVSFDLVRYYEGDLALGGAGVPDGGGHLFVDGSEYVFQTDVAGQPETSTTFVGITANGGTIPASGRYEVGEWPDFPKRISADMPLGDVVFGDGADPDEFVDAGNDYDVGIALANQFTLGPQEQATYETRTRFGSGAPSGAPSVDHYRCYKTKPVKGQPKFATVHDMRLVDPFADVMVEVKKPRDLCVPAGTAAGAIIDPATQLRRYQIKAEKGQPKPTKHTNVRLDNRLGTLFFDTMKPELLLVPAAKDPLVPPDPPDLATIGVDHYECYKAKISKGTPRMPKGMQTTATDDLGGVPRRLELKKPTRLCTPVAASGEGTKHPEHLVCYAVRPTKGRCDDAAPVNAGGGCKKEPDCGGTKGQTSLCVRQAKFVKVPGLFVRDQLVAAQLDVVKEDELCVPSTAAP